MNKKGIWIYNIYPWIDNLETSSQNPLRRKIYKGWEWLGHCYQPFWKVSALPYAITLPLHNYVSFWDDQGRKCIIKGLGQGKVCTTVGGSMWVMSSLGTKHVLLKLMRMTNSFRLPISCWSKVTWHKHHETEHSLLTSRIILDDPLMSVYDNRDAWTQRKSLKAY